MPDPQNIQNSATSTSSDSVPLSGNQVNTLLLSPAVANQVLPSLINSGALPNVTINDYNSATASQKAAYTAQITNKIANNDQKLTQIASNALSNLGYGT